MFFQKNKINLLKFSNTFLLNLFMFVIFYLLLIIKTGFSINFNIDLLSQFIHYFDNRRVIRFLFYAVIISPIIIYSIISINNLKFHKILFLLQSTLFLVLLLLLVQDNVIKERPNFAAPTPFLDTQKSNGVLIAHGGGAINTITYTNSKEALLQSFDNKYTFIELDMLITKDSRILAAHDWKSVDNSTQSNSRILDEIISHKIYDKYTFLYDETILKHFFENPQSVLVTDKIKDFDLITKYLPLDKTNQLIVEVFSLKDYFLALRKGIKYPALSVGANSLIEYYDFLDNGVISMITCSISLIETHELLLQHLHNKGVNILAYTSNDIPFIQKHLGKTVAAFYTDYITIEDLNNASK